MEEGQGTPNNNVAENNTAPVIEERVDTGVADALQGLVSSETLEKLRAANKTETQAASTTNTEQTPKGEGSEEGKDGNGNEDPNKDKGETKEEKEPKVEKKNALGVTVKKLVTEKKPEFVTENMDQVLEVVKSKFGQELKDVKDLPKFFETAQKWRADSQKIEEITSIKDKMESVLNGLPDDIISSMQMYYEGKDYMKAFENKPKFNFDIPVEKQDIKALVNHYFPNKFSDEDFVVEEEGEEKSQALQIAEQASIDKFNAQKQAIDTQRATIAENAKKQNDNFVNSVSSSVKFLKQSFPEADENDVKNIEKVLQGGANAIVSYFCNSDGTIKENAAEALMLAVHGKEVINDMMTVASHATETKLNEEILSRGNETKKVKAGNDSNQISDEAKQVLAELNKFKKTTTF